jgi:hypothetical protein
MTSAGGDAREFAGPAALGAGAGAGSLARGSHAGAPKHRACWDGKLADCPWAAIVSEIGDLLATLPCAHGETEHGKAATPPMMYAEWIACVVGHARGSADTGSTPVGATPAGAREPETGADRADRVDPVGGD